MVAESRMNSQSILANLHRICQIYPRMCALFPATLWHVPQMQALGVIETSGFQSKRTCKAQWRVAVGCDDLFSHTKNLEDRAGL